MLQEIFTTLTHAIEGTPALALGASVVWGILSILLSPCHLASIPLIVGYINGQGRIGDYGGIGAVDGGCRALW